MSNHKPWGMGTFYAHPPETSFKSLPTPVPHSLADAALPIARHKANLMTCLGNYSDDLIESLPRWDHIVTKKAYFPCLARKLIDSPKRPLIADKLSALGMLRDSVEEFWSEVGVVFGLSGDEAGFESAEAAAALDSAQHTMCIVAACNVVEDFHNSPRGRDMAAAVLKKSAHLVPEPLRKLLEKEASG